MKFERIGPVPEPYRPVVITLETDQEARDLMLVVLQNISVPEAVAKATDAPHAYERADRVVQALLDGLRDQGVLNS